MDVIDELNRIGQHLWLDDISTTVLDDGSIARYRDECGVTGVTANPTIFERAIASGAYDRRIGASEGDPADVFWELAIDDVRRAADLLSDVHRRSRGRTGWVSIELSPHLANDADASVEHGEQLHGRIERPNVMVKVPGTPDADAAIEELVYRGVPVNVTLLFGLAQWRTASDAYRRGLERRRDAGRSLTVASVASFFLSRIDRRLDPLVDRELAHRAAIACARQVHDEWCRTVDGERWGRLLGDGAQTQQLLWASTSPKSDDLDELHYARRLAAADTVITVPSVTLDELCRAEGSSVQRLDELDISDVRHDIAMIEASAGITLEEVAAELQVAGVTSFQESFDSLLETIRRVQGDMAMR